VTARASASSTATAPNGVSQAPLGQIDTPSNGTKWEGPTSTIDFGVYATVVQPGRIRLGDEVVPVA